MCVIWMGDIIENIMYLKDIYINIWYLWRRFMFKEKWMRKFCFINYG